MEIKTFVCDLCGLPIQEGEDVYEYYLGPKRSFGVVSVTLDHLHTECALAIQRAVEPIIEEHRRAHQYVTEADTEDTGPTDDEIAEYFASEASEITHDDILP